MMKKAFYGAGMIALALAAMIEEPFNAQIAAILSAIVCLASAKALDEVERRTHGKRYMDIRATSDR